jgi:4'-phosphopantetheinyl transferase
VIDAWLLSLGAPNPRVVAAAWPLLAGWERDRLNRFVFESDRELYAAAHGLLRVALTARHPEVAIDRWVVDRTAAGAPVVLGPVADPPRVSLSHTSGLAACAVAATAIGVDVEAVDRGLELEPLLERVVSPTERASWPTSPEESRHRFFQTWVAKEALLKGLGLGFGCEPSSVTMAMAGVGSPNVVELPAAIGRAADWWIGFLDPPVGYLAAVAVSAESTEIPTIAHHRLDAQALQALM